VNRTLHLTAPTEDINAYKDVNSETSDDGNKGGSDKKVGSDKETLKKDGEMDGVDGCPAQLGQDAQQTGKFAGFCMCIRIPKLTLEMVVQETYPSRANPVSAGLRYP
jgi:hypothetical protein